MERKELVKKILAKDYFAELAGLKIDDVDEKRAVVSAEIGQKHLNAHGTIQGGMLFTIADYAFAVLCNYLHPITVTQVSNITFIKAAKTDKLYCTAKELTRQGRNCVTEVTVTDSNGEVVAVGTCNGFIKEMSIEDIIKHYCD